MDGATPVSTRLRRATPYHDAYTVRVYDERFAALATARPAEARRWVATTRWLHGGLIYRGRLIVGLGVQWTPTRASLRGGEPHVPATLQLCVGHRCLVFHLARADAVPEALRRFLADPRVTFVGSGSAYDARILWDHYGLDVARGQELRAVAGMGNASVEQMAGRFLGYPGIRKPKDVAMSAWHAPRLSHDQVQYAAVDAYLAFRLGIALLCPGAAPPPVRAPQPAPVPRRPPVQPAPRVVRAPLPPALCHVPTVFCALPMPAPAVGFDAAITGGKIMDTHHGVLIDEESDTDNDIGCYDDVYRAATRGLPVRAYASDSDYSVDCSDGFEHVRFGAFTDEEDEKDLVADDVDGSGNEEGCNDDYVEDEEGACDEELEDDEGCDEEKLEDEGDEEGCNEEGGGEGCTEGDQDDEEGNTDDEDQEDDEEGYTDGEDQEDDEEGFCLL